MPFDPPSQASVVQRVKSDFRTEVGVNPLRRSPELGLLIALAGQSKGLYSHQAFIFRQCFPDSAEAQYFWRWAAIYGITQKVAAQWQGTVTFTGVDTTVIPEGTELSRSDGVIYTTDEDGTIASGTVDIPCTAVDGGELGNLDDGDPLVLAGAIIDVDSDCLVASTTITGTDVEEPADGLVRLLQRLRTPPSGGVSGDYVRWALEVEGVTRAWERSPAPGEVYVSFVRDDDGTGVDILPGGGELTDTQDYIQSKAPITVIVTCPELSALSVGVEITDLDPDTVDVRAAIEESLEDFFFREAEPGGTINISRLREAVSNATGESSHTLVSPIADVVAAADEMPLYDGLTVT